MPHNYGGIIEEFERSDADDTKPRYNEEKIINTRFFSQHPLYIMYSFINPHEPLTIQSKQVSTQR